VPGWLAGGAPVAGAGEVGGGVAGDGAPGLPAGFSVGLSFSGETCVTLHSIVARFSSGVVGPPFSKPRQSTLEI
jgi:hypothetical protein